MNSFDGANTVYLVLLIVLLLGSLIGSQLPLGKALRMAMIWVALFAGVFILFAFRSNFSAFGQQVRAELTGEPIAAGETLRIPISEDGHFWVDARINGQPVRLLVDSGASITTIGGETARAAGVASGLRAPVQTANGTVDMARSRADNFELGPIRREGMTIFVNPGDRTNVLGMNFLTSLSSWRVEGNHLVLTA
ncbi:TIGR02281 family clan AA aspartic protease [Sphingomonas lutea]|uniref:TIGR02281 family clan AA aspartic protease n=1 Tax=Sphingomonas lutea TaxID=1045317 RepID=A0A7G9SFL7_9SPHN|nr:TIGR02281 family clan AA aspartic protease [Sphingomonas lutea]QNN66642.1 TIGR02281 family clan AA aspartic protease [Sphingomonas lutea]